MVVFFMLALQIPDSWLQKAVQEYLNQKNHAGIEVTAAAAPVEITIQDNNLALLLAEGHEIDRYDLPMRLDLLMADVMWLAARRREAAEKSITLNADFTLAPHDFKISSDGKTASLTGREIALLQFMREAGECSKEELLEKVWRYHPESATHTVETHLWRLRQKLQNAGMDAPLIVTTENGYRIA